MSISVCIATRGRMELLGQTVSRTLETAVLPDTKIVIGFDRDEADNIKVDSNQPIDGRVIVSIADREDSLGAKYNRIAAAAPASDLYLVATDDCALDTPGWDKMLATAFPVAFPDGIGVLYCGSMDSAGMNSSLPSMHALSVKFIQKVGYFCTPDFPTWFHDTWIDELATMIGRVVIVPGIAARYPSLGEARKSRGVRDVHFWAQYFEKRRADREAVARAIINDAEFAAPDKRKRALLQVIEELRPHFTARNQPILDAANAVRLEAALSFDAPDDERYQRIKSAAEKYLDESNTKRKPRRKRTQPALRVVA